MRVLITGATGLIGQEITRLCHVKGIAVNYLTTSKNKIRKEPKYTGFYWNPATGEIDPNCFHGVGVVINLAGENVFQRWTRGARKRILESRVQAAGVLYESLQNNEHQVDQVIAASAIGIYPSSYKKMYYEDEKNLATDFLGTVVRKWELANDQFESLGIKIAKVRIGLVLAKDAGALPKMQMSFKYNAGSGLGSGNQWQSWIHITDLARMFIHILEGGLTGVYNGVSPNPLKNNELMEEVGTSMNKKIWLPNVPPFALKVVMGEMSNMVLSSQLVASKKIQETGFHFVYTRLNKVLKNLASA